MIKIRLLGELGKKFGRTHVLAIKSPAEAIRALCANFPEFQNFVSTSGDRGVAYRVIADRSSIDEKQLHDPVGKFLVIAPVIQGAGGGGGGILQAIVGVVLIAASFVPGLQFLAPIGVAMVLGGVVQMLSPVPQTSANLNGAQDQQGVDPSAYYYGQKGISAGSGTEPSYVFNGAVNTTAQGHPVPLGYGRMRVGSAVISAGIVTEEIS